MALKEGKNERRKATGRDIVKMAGIINIQIADVGVTIKSISKAIHIDQTVVSRALHPESLVEVQDKILVRIKEIKKEKVEAWGK